MIKNLNHYDSLTIPKFESLFRKKSNNASTMADFVACLYLRLNDFKVSESWLRANIGVPVKVVDGGLVYDNGGEEVLLVMEGGVVCGVRKVNE